MSDINAFLNLHHEAVRAAKELFLALSAENPHAGDYEEAFFNLTEKAGRAGVWEKVNRSGVALTVADSKRVREARFAEEHGLNEEDS